jgi:DNA-binding CsgD family transcriptional regulator
VAGRREQALALIGEFYRTPGSEAQWQYVFDALADFLRLRSVQIIELHLPSQANGVIRGWGFEDHWKKRYDQHYAKVNPVMNREQAPHGIVYSTDSHIREIWKRSEYFNDFLVPQDNYYGCGGVGILHGEVAEIWGLMWPRRNGEPGRGQRELVARLVPHLANRLRIEQHIATLDAEKRSLQRALELLGAACAVLDARGRALWYNRPAERLLAAGDGLRLGREGRLLARRPACAAALRRSLSGALGIVSAEQLEVPAAVAVERPSGKRPYHLFVWPLVPGEGEGLDAARALVLINDPTEKPPAVAALLGRLYGLTPAEARVAAGLVAGASPKEIAEQHAVSLHTVRSQIRQLLDKAGCRRQTQLIATLYRSLGRLVR